MELTVESLIGELGLELISGGSSAQAHVRWVHSTELADPTPWLKGGEMLLTTGLQLEGPKVQREYLERLVEHDIAALGFGTGFRHKKVPAALVKAAQDHSFPLFEVPYELPFIAITERAFTQLLDERYELLQRNMVGDLLAEALSGHLYPEDLQARLRPFGIGERIAVLAFAVQDPSAAAAMVERLLDAERVGKLVAIRGGLVCAVVDAGDGRGGAPFDAVALAARIRAALAPRVGEVRAAASRVGPTHSLRHELPRGALRPGGGAAAQRQRAGCGHLRGPRRLPAAALAAGRGGAQLLLPQRARPDRAGRGRVR